MRLLRAVVVAVLLVLVAVAAAEARPARLPLGPPRLAEHRSTRTLAPGLTRTTIVRGRRSRRDVFVVEAAFVTSRAAARRAGRRLIAAGHPPRVRRAGPRAADDPRRGPVGYSVRTGSFRRQAPADALTARLAKRRFPAAQTLYTGEDGGRTTGPWVVRVLTVDPRRFTGRVVAALGTGVVPGRERVSALARRMGALAAVNGGYFVVGPADGTEGDLAGVSVIDGRLVSEAVRDRTALVLPAGDGTGASIGTVATRNAVVAADGARRELDGLNRRPGLIRACGGVGGDRPTERPLHDITCRDRSELIRFEPVFGSRTPAGAGAEAVLGADGGVIAVRERRGGPIPAGGAVLSATGTAAGWLRAHVRAGQAPSVRETVAGPGGLGALAPGLGVVNGGPRLLRAGRPAIDAYTEGFVHPDDAAFYFAFGIRRNPRTMAGLTRAGKLLFVTVDGHAPAYSVGASFREEARIMRALGAREALNLDGGGSTTMVAGGHVVGRPSDPEGERPVGDALLLMP